MRYPGGKSALLDLISSILSLNDLDRRPYAEPFAGGAGLALGLLYGGYVSEIHLNDIDPSIWAFWHSILNETSGFVELIKSADLTIPGWRRQREIHAAEDMSHPLELGFSAFYLNRTNRSGIIKGAGVIGGLDQTGSYKMDCRFNRDDLVKRVERVAKYRSRIALHRLDAIDFIRRMDEELPVRSLLCIDPPYFNKGSSLYTSFYRSEDHGMLSREILGLRRPWVVTYDAAPEICALYDSRPLHQVRVNYSVQIKRKAGEILVPSPGLQMPDALQRFSSVA